MKQHIVNRFAGTQSLFDVQAVKDANPIEAELARRGIRLRSRRGPCPKCGGKDRFYVTTLDRFACRKCHPEHGDVIELVVWLDGVDFRQACETLGGTVATNRTPKPVAPPAELPDFRARATVQYRRLWVAEGASYREYLASRGLDIDTLDAWRVGCDPVWHAVSFPVVIGSRVVAIKYRLLQPKFGVGRYLSETGSRHVAPFVPRKLRAARALVLLEGEMNAMSVWQADPDLDVASLGAETPGAELLAACRELASRYAQVVIWADRPDVAVSVARAVRRPSKLMRSPDEGGVKMDANAILTKHGPDVLRDLVAGFLAAPCARCGGAADVGYVDAQPGRLCRACVDALGIDPFDVA